jgi:hypothetical protein
VGIAAISICGLLQWHDCPSPYRLTISPELFSSTARRAYPSDRDGSDERLSLEAEDFRAMWSFSPKIVCLWVDDMKFSIFFKGIYSTYVSISQWEWY